MRELSPVDIDKNLRAMQVEQSRADAANAATLTELIAERNTAQGEAAAARARNEHLEADNGALYERWETERDRATFYKLQADSLARELEGLKQQRDATGGERL